jgi:gamma-glutamyl-gamma-aminobutyraldehyde dehydrogenase
VIAEITSANADDVDLAVEKAREAFDQGHWSKMDPDGRKDVLIRLCKLMTRNRRELAVMESLESGKPILDCETIDIPEAIHTIKWHAEAIDKIYDQTAPTGDDALSIIVREPIGVVAAVLPWNFPLLMLAVENRPCLGGGLFGNCETCRTNQSNGPAHGGIGGRGGRATRRVSGVAWGWSICWRTLGDAYGH